MARNKLKPKPIPKQLRDLLAEKSRLLSQAQAYSEMELAGVARSLWEAAASLEEIIAPWMDALDRPEEAALHRVSAASCCVEIGDWSRAANLYRGALSGPLRTDILQDVERMLAKALRKLPQPIRAPALVPLRST